MITRVPLLWKLIVINIAIVAVVMVSLWLTIDYRAASYFTELMRQYNISPATLHQMFLDAVHRYLILVTVGAVVFAGGLHLILTRRLLRPLMDISDAAQRIAAGDYSERIAVTSHDEVGDVATAFNRMADSLERTEHLRRTMVIDVAHELRTPLTNIRGYLEALRDGVIAPTAEQFDSLHEETLRLVKLVESLLELAQAEAAMSSLQKIPVDLREIVEQALALFQSRFREKDLSVTTAYDVDAEVQADPGKLTQVLQNLLQNAWQYTPTAGKVSVSIERAPSGFRITVFNTSEPIPPEDLPYIFERFYRSEKSRSREHGGEGIGLAIARELVQAHGGRMGAKSDRSGTRIWLILPAETRADRL